MDGPPARRRLPGADAIRAALAAGAEVPLVLLARDASDAARAAADAVRAAGGSVVASSANELRRLADRETPVDCLGLAGPPPGVPLAEAMRRPGAAWILCGLRFPGNVGFALRTVEVAGAACAAVCGGSAPPLEGAAKRAALRASMGAHRFFPVAWTGIGEALDAAAGAGRRLVAIEDVPGAAPPWDADLPGPVAFVAGGERDGLPRDVLARCDAAVRLPMRGFIPAFNVHAAVAAVCAETLRRQASVSP